MHNIRGIPGYGYTDTKLLSSPESRLGFKNKLESGSVQEYFRARRNPNLCQTARDKTLNRIGQGHMDVMNMRSKLPNIKFL